MKCKRCGKEVNETAMVSKLGICGSCYHDKLVLQSDSSELDYVVERIIVEVDDSGNIVGKLLANHNVIHFNEKCNANLIDILRSYIGNCIEITGNYDDSLKTVFSVKTAKSININRNKIK